MADGLPTHHSGSLKTTAVHEATSRLVVYGLSKGEDPKSYTTDMI
jgi:hypothetical protein